MGIDRHRRSGFTLVELLIVILMLGVLAAIVIPQFTNSSEQARRSSRDVICKSLRSQIQLYRLQHGDELRDLAAASAGGNHFEPLTTATTYGSPPKDVGPYVERVPVNPVTRGSVVMDAVSFSGGLPDPVPGADFIYDYGGGAGTGRIWGTTDRASCTPAP